MRKTQLHAFSFRCLWLVLLLFVPIACYLAATVSFGTPQVERWLPQDHPQALAYHQFKQDFGDDQFVIVTWEECTLQDPRLASVTQALQELAFSQPDLEIREVTSSPEAVDQVMAYQANLSYEQALAKLRKIAFGEDGSCFITLRVGSAKSAQRRELIDAIVKTSTAASGLGQQDLILAGEPLQVSVVDRASRETVQYFVAPSTLLSLLFALLCLRELRLTLIVFAIAGFGQLTGMALVAYFLGELSDVMIVLPTLVFMLTLSAAIHLTNYYIDTGRTGVRSGTEALLMGLRPCLLATLTTAFGFASLAVSLLAPVWQFGSLAASGVLIASGVLLLVFPAAIEIGYRRPCQPRGRQAKSTPATGACAAELPTAGLSSWFTQNRLCSLLTILTSRYATPITLAGFCLLAIAVSGLTRLRSSTEFADMFPADKKPLRDLRWVGQHLGPIDTFEYVVEFKDRDSSDLLDRISILTHMHTALQRSFHSHAVASAATILPRPRQNVGTRATIKRAIYRKKLGDVLPELEQARILKIDGQNERWRISVKVNDLLGENYDTIRQQLEKAILAGRADALTSLSAKGQEQFSAGNPTVVLTGMRPVIQEAHRALLNDLGMSFVTAFALITPVMMLIVGSVPGGLLLMVPNTLPVILVFGSMGWLGIRLDVASLLTASVALGIAVDDTLHFMTWYLRGRKSGKSPRGAVRSAIDSCAKPMLHTTAICTGAMLPFFLADFLPTSKFALLMILILSGAILGDLLLLPAILQSRLGRQLGAKRRGV